VLRCAVLCCAVLCCAVLCCAALRCAALCYAADLHEGQRRQCNEHVLLADVHERAARERVRVLVVHLLCGELDALLEDVQHVVEAHLGPKPLHASLEFGEVAAAT
jgi:hypothetical protein